MSSSDSRDIFFNFIAILSQIIHVKIIKTTEGIITTTNGKQYTSSVNSQVSQFDIIKTILTQFNFIAQGISLESNVRQMSNFNPTSE